MQHAQIHKQDNDNPTLVRLNPTITHLYVNSGNFATTSGFWMAVFTTLKNPRRLDFHDFGVLQGDALDAFWRACSRFEEISVKWFKMCSNLTKLHILNNYAEFPIEAFAKALELQTWAQLTDLALTGSGGSDDPLSLVTRQLPPLGRFQHESAGFGPRSFAFLQPRLFDNVKTLDIQRCNGLLSRTILDILTGCSLLEVLKAFSVSVSDPRSNPESWICLRPKHLEVFFVTDSTRSNDDGELVFKQLSRLERLETLNLNVHHTWALSWDIFSRAKKLSSLRWRLDSGLQHLSTLRRLRTLTIDSLRHDAQMEDVQWMLVQWPVLETVTCSLSQDPLTRKRFVNLFRQHNVILEAEDE
ncbi:hypothetical protein BGX30_011849 [Mortierella sp. GBA39]|nr:hypothetical protein BGX30_011849 [Mortierella sp. GBA39]